MAGEVISEGVEVSQQSHMKKPARIVPIAEAEAETHGNLQGVVDAALRIAEGRAEKHRRMKAAILANDTAGALALACEVVGFSQREAATRVEALLAAVTGSAHNGLDTHRDIDASH